MTTNLDFCDGEFDAVICIFAIFFADNMKGQIDEMCRLVKPGGKLAVITWGPRTFEPAYSHWNRYQKSIDLTCYNHIIYGIKLVIMII